MIILIAYSCIQMITNNINTNTNAEKRVRELVDSFEDERVLKVLINKIECKEQY